MSGVDRDDPLGEAGEAEWERLRKQIEFASGFWLGFIFSPSPRSVLVLRARVKQLLAAEGSTVLVYRPESPEDLGLVLPRLLLDPEPLTAGCTWVEAVRSDSPGAPVQPWTQAWNELFLRMNERRDALRARLPGGLVFAGPPELKPRVRESAPDLWSVRSIVVDLKINEYDARSHESEVTRHYKVPELDVAPDPEFALAEARRRGARHAAGPQALAFMDAAKGLLAKGRTAEARDAALEARELVRGQDAHDEARALALLARAESADGDTAAAKKHINSALSRWTALGLGPAPLDWHVLAGDLALSEGDLVEAKRAYAGAEAIARENRRTRGSREAMQDLSIVLRRIGALRRQSGDLPAAAMAYQEALSLGRMMGEHYGETRAALDAIEAALRSLGAMTVSSGDLATAAATLGEAVELGRRKLRLLGETPEAMIPLAHMLGMLAETRCASGELPGAITALEECAEITRRLIARYGPSYRDMLVRTLKSIAAARRGQGDEPAARAAEEEAAALAATG